MAERPNPNAKSKKPAAEPVLPAEAREEESSQLQSMLVKRLVVAGGMVGVLLGTLAFFDYLASPDDNDPPVFTQPVPVPPRKEITQPVRPVENLPPPPEAEKPAEPDKTPVPPPPKPAVEPPPPPKVGATATLPPAATGKIPASPPAPAGRPATVEKPAPARPTPQTGGHTGASETPPPPTPERTEPVQSPSPAPAAAAKTLPARITDVAAMRAPLAAMRSPNGFVLQAGVFASTQRAEELHAKLTLNGIPSTLEARVQVGPFKSREEADAAYAKLRKLGIDAMLIPPANLRR